MANAKGKTQAKPATDHEAGGGGERDFDGSSAERNLSNTLQRFPKAFRSTHRNFRRRSKTQQCVPAATRTINA